MENKTSKIPLIAAVGVCLIFSWLVGYGWYRTFNSWTGNVVLGVTAGVMFAIIAIILGIAIAKQRVENPINISNALSYFFILILLSALGTINTLYFNVAGTKIVTQEIEGAMQKIDALKNRAPIILATPDYQSWQAKVKVAEFLVYEEIKNKNLCGQGPEALRRIDELRKLLPSFKILAGQGCGNTSDLISQYEEMVRKLIESSQEKALANPFIEASEAIVINAEKLKENLKKLLEKTKKAEDIESARIELKAAVVEFNQMKDRLDIVSGKQSNADLVINTKGIDSIGNPGEILSFMASRMNEASTYIYLVIALLIDVTLISAFRAVIEVDPAPSGVRRRNDFDKYM